MKTCTKCNKEKDIIDFYFRTLNVRMSQCKECTKRASSEYNKNNKVKKKERDKNYCFKNKERISNGKKIYYVKNKEKIKQSKKNWYDLNKYSILLRAKEYRISHKEIRNSNERNRIKTDLIYKLRTNMSKAICYSLKINNSYKIGSILKFLPYTMQELKEHLEKQFEPWMNWTNRGKYNISTWNDEDKSTWTWQLDHIIPQSTFKYTSMEDQAFKDCWSLSNLRPLSAKQNVLDGVKLSKGR